LKDIINTNNYVYELICTYQNVEKEFIDKELIRHSQTYNFEEKSNNELSLLQEQLNYIQRRYEGLLKENEVKDRVEKIFDDKLEHSKYQYSHYDYAGATLFYEMKSIKMNYPNVFIGTDKIICNNLIFIYTFENLPNKLFYIKYDTDLFSTFEKKYVKPANRLYTNEVYLIPQSLLIEITDTDRVCINTIDETELRNEIIVKDYLLSSRFSATTKI
jgi:hypothetical protein